LGAATVDPAGPVVAGSIGVWRVTITVGKHGIDDGGSIIIARRDVCDWERPQVDRPRASGYVTVTTTGQATVRASYDPARYVRPWRAALVIDVVDGALAEGDRVTITYGDREAGGPGMRAQTFAESAFELKVLVDAFGTGVYCELSASPVISIIGGYPDALHLVVPSLVGLDAPFGAGVRVVDSFGNPSSFFSGEVSIDCPSDPAVAATVRLGPEDGGAARIDGIRLTSTGLHRLRARAGDLVAVSNPCRCRAGDDGPLLYWGDLHGQTGQTVGTGTLDEYFTFGRDKAFLDFIGWQGNDFQITDSLWADVKEHVKRYHAPGRFVTYLGYEWSGLSPAGGDHNIHFLGDDAPLHRSSHWQVDDDSDLAADRYPLFELWRELADRQDVLAVAHVGGRHANLDALDPELVPVIEVHSHHGTFEWMIEDALRRDLRVGFICGSDDHTCRPGLSYPTEATSRGLTSFDVPGGLTAVFAPELTRAAVWQALKRRSCYGTTGARILLDVTADGAPMGAAIQTPRPPALAVSVAATAPLLEVELYRGESLIYRAPFRRPATPAERSILVLWSGVRVRGRQKLVDWSGHLQVRQGRIVAVRPVAFDRADEGITRLTNQRVAWRSTTGGDGDGLILTVDGDDAVLDIVTPPLSLECRVAEIGFTPRVYPAGGVNQRVVIAETTFPPGPDSWEFKYEADQFAPGVHPYWLRVIQEDGHMAWSSPIYVEVTGSQQNVHHRGGAS
jgi:hypothetical protein